MGEVGKIECLRRTVSTPRVAERGRWALGVMKPAHMFLLALIVLTRPAFAWDPLTESREQDELH
jgi:hypothetical protein